jgi:hypothetical protein
MNEDIQAALLEILKAHSRLRADYQELIARVHASNHAEPLLGHALRRPLDDDTIRSIQEEDTRQVEGLENALRENRPFATLLREYAALWRPTLNDSIQQLRSGFQQKV